MSPPPLPAPFTFEPPGIQRRHPPSRPKAVGARESEERIDPGQIADRLPAVEFTALLAALVNSTRESCCEELSP